MGSNTMGFPLIDATVIVDWNDVNLRIGSVTWTLNSAATVRVRIYRVDISPDPVVDRVIVGPASGSENVPGNLRMEEYTDPEYPEEGMRLRYPVGLVFNVEVVP